MDSALMLRDVRKSFGSTKAVDGMTLTVPHGKLYGVIGPNGAGKTTCIRMNMSILFPDSGELSVLGGRSALEAKDWIGYLPEETSGRRARISSMKNPGSPKCARQMRRVACLSSCIRTLSCRRTAAPNTGPTRSTSTTVGLDAERRTNVRFNRTLPFVFAGLLVFGIPPVNTFAMMVRLASTTPPPFWQVALSVAIGLVSALAAMWFAAKVFKVGLLLHGKPPTLSTLIKWARMA